MTVRECYEMIGADYEDVLNRMLGKEALVEKFAKKFLDDNSYEQLIKAMQEKNTEEAFRAAHTLKGVAQNLSFTGLYQPASALTEILRKGEMDGTQELLQQVCEEYKKTISFIEQVE